VEGMPAACPNRTRRRVNRTETDRALH
jgi:hypothetical protein